MRTWIWIAMTTACGPMSSGPGGPPSRPAPPAPTAALAGPAPMAASAGSAPMAVSRDDDPAEPADDSYAVVQGAQPAAASRGAPRSDAAAWIDAHNKVRAQHCAAALTWSAKLADVAQRWANALRDRGCAFGHSGGSFGENLAAGTIGTLDPAAVVQMWYDEVAQYRFPDGGFSMKTGHFTQVVWRGTRQVGCGHAQCKGMDILVCEYDPAGNWEGQYRDNVLPRSCRK